MKHISGEIHLDKRTHKVALCAQNPCVFYHKVFGLFFDVIQGSNMHRLEITSRLGLRSTTIAIKQY